MYGVFYRDQMASRKIPFYESFFAVGVSQTLSSYRHRTFDKILSWDLYASIVNLPRYNLSANRRIEWPIRIRRLLKQNFSCMKNRIASTEKLLLQCRQLLQPLLPRGT